MAYDKKLNAGFSISAKEAIIYFNFLWMKCSVLSSRKIPHKVDFQNLLLVVDSSVTEEEMDSINKEAESMMESMILSPNVDESSSFFNSKVSDYKRNPRVRKDDFYPEVFELVPS